jgi:hypothetical protein
LIFEETVNDELEDEAEFVGTLRAFAKLMGFPVQTKTTSGTVNVITQA